MKFKLTNARVAAAFEFVVTVQAAILASQLLWFIAESAVDRLA